jgi:hypothetical protein
VKFTVLAPADEQRGDQSISTMDRSTEDGKICGTEESPSSDVL